MRLPRRPGRSTTSAVIILVMLAIGRCTACSRPQSSLPLATLTSSPAAARIHTLWCDPGTAWAASAGLRATRDEEAQRVTAATRDRGRVRGGNIGQDWQFRARAATHQPVGEGIPSVYPAALLTPTTALPWRSARFVDPAAVRARR